MKCSSIVVAVWLMSSFSPAPASEPALSAAPRGTSILQFAASTPVSIAVEGVCPDDGHMFEGGGYAIQLAALIDTGGFQSLELAEVFKDGLPASPANAPTVRGLDGALPPAAQRLILYWIPAAGEAGVWEFCFEARNDLGDADTLCADIDVAPPDPDHLVWEPAEFRYHEGSGPFDVELRLSSYHGHDTLAGIDFRFAVRERSGSAFLALPFGASDFVFPPAYDNFNGGPGFYGRSLDAISPDTFGIFRYALGPYALIAGGPYTTFFSAMLRAQPGIMAIDSLKDNGVGILIYYRSESIPPTYSPGCFAVTAGPPCTITLTGDANHDGALGAADIISLVNYIFKSGAPPEPCVSAGDVNCDAVITAADLIYMLIHVFRSGPAPCDVCTMNPDIWACP